MRGYLYITPTPRVALSAVATYDRFHADKSVNPIIPEQADTTSLSLGLRYFVPTGWSTEVVGNLVHQEVERRRFDFPEFPEGTSTFLTLDAAVRYQFPRRGGLFRIEARNLLGQRFDFLDNNYRSAEDVVASPYIPERSIYFGLTLYF